MTGTGPTGPSRERDPEAPAEFRRVETEGHALLVARGDIDVYTSPDFRAALYGLVDSGDDPVVIDFSEVSFIDSSGLGVLVGALKRARERDGEIELRGLSSTTRKVLEITGLTSLFTIRS
jgi:anti-sigma B factor antagonist